MIYKLPILSWIRRFALPVCFVSFLFFTINPLQATVLSPWLRNLFEFEGGISYGYDRIHRIQTPEGSFSDIRNNHHLDLSLGISPWPNWDVEAEMYFSHSPDILFAYEAFLLTGRYLILDDIAGDPFSLAIGATFSFPGERFIKDLSYVYHGHVNGEVHIGIGKEFPNCYFDTWGSRFWALAGVGTADKGSPWIHGIIAAEWQICCIQTGLFSELLFGLGHQNINPFIPFDGYASIAHRSVDAGAFVTYQIDVLGSITCVGFYNAYAHDFPEHTFGFQIDLLIPFSL